MPYGSGSFVIRPNGCVRSDVGSALFVQTQLALKALEKKIVAFCCQPTARKKIWANLFGGGGTPPTPPTPPTSQGEGEIGLRGGQGAFEPLSQIPPPRTQANFPHGPAVPSCQEEPCPASFAAGSSTPPRLSGPGPQGHAHRLNSCRGNSSSSCTTTVTGHFRVGSTRLRSGFTEFLCPQTMSRDREACTWQRRHAGADHGSAVLT